MKHFSALKPHLYAVLIFLAITIIYLFPIIEGKDVRQMDMTHFAGMSRELVVYNDTTGQYSQWTNSMFSGMPAYHAGPISPNYNLFSYINKILRINLSYNSAGILFVMMLCFYVLLIIMKVGSWVAIAGSIAFAFSTYNPVIIVAGHVTKAWAIAYIPLIIAGVILTYRGRYTVGGILTLLGLGLNISSNHFQITYYAGFIVMIFVIGYFIEAIKKKELRNYITASAILLGVAILSILPNAIAFYTNYELGKTSIRSSSELSVKDDSQKAGGLDKDYAFTWSYGKAESFSLLIPNFMGGSSTTSLSENSELYQELKRRGVADAEQYIKQVPAYWGDMPFTSGPAYHGAIVCFLFILGLYIVKSAVRWYLLAATILSLFLAWGYHFQWFNDLMFYYFPLYSKFRTVSMSMVIAQFAMPFLGILALWEFLTNTGDKIRLMKGLKWSAIITGGIALVFLLLGRSLFDFASPADTQILSQVPDWFYKALVADRARMMTSDAFRSLIFVLLGAGVLFLSLKSPKWIKYAAPAFIILILADMWPVAKRYLSEDDFVSKSKKYDFQQSVADKAILQDKSPSFRVLNLNNPFNEVNTSYFHKSIGGYHGAKQRRYQELIEHNIQPELISLISVFSDKPSTQRIDSALNKSQVLNMLNAKYIIYNPGAPPIENPFANGNAWFVNEFSIVENADNEMERLNSIDSKKIAVIDKRFSGIINSFVPENDTTASIELISYRPNELVYRYSTTKPQMALFSEVYYPYGWKAYIDGNEHEHFRANWILRGMILPEGQHDLVFTFKPAEVITAAKIAKWSSILLGLFILGIGVYNFYRLYKTTPTDN
jgi:hypothetical protein